MAVEQPILFFPNPLEWERWLEDNFDDPVGVRLKFAKKASGVTTMTYAEALDVALCFGWIDGQKFAFDDTYYLLRFTPRRARSKWSDVNRGHVARLTKEKRMRPSGIAEVERAKADDRWANAYPSPSKITVPDDFAEALRAVPKAEAFFATVNASNRYAFLYRIHDAKRPETRQKRIMQFVKMLAEGRVIH